MSTDIYFNNSPTTIKTTRTEETQLDKNSNPLQNSNASSSVLMFESPTAEVPDRTTTPFRSVNINVDEPLDRSQFAVYEGKIIFYKQKFPPFYFFFFFQERLLLLICLSKKYYDVN